MSKGLENQRDQTILGFGTNIFSFNPALVYLTAPNQGQGVFATFAFNQFFAPKDVMIKAITYRSVFFVGGGTVDIQLIKLIPIILLPKTLATFTAGAQTRILKDINQEIKQGEGIGVRLNKVGGVTANFSCFGSILAEFLNWLMEEKEMNLF